jgi:hypothetical protein
MILSMLSTSSFAEFSINSMPNLTTAALSPVCNKILENGARKLGLNQGLCIGIILGVEDNANYDQKICVPKNANIKDRIQIVRDYVATQPNRFQEAFASLAFDAMEKKWPCPIR